ncbi:DoxX family protein [Chitinophaga vietnamensis]|uniref:DoxX family protein n=1 Tax=Chitinophaga vietnamensis TaxID=2593957 RepID=UPI0011775604|nr:DoxX family protein [Chitinophaga vietnamensis]
MTTLTLQKTAKRDKILFWVFTSLIFLLDSVIPAFTFNTELAKQGIAHLGYPDYFRIELTIGKVLGGLLLILPMVPPRYKEWAYVGFGINFISAFVGHTAVDGFGGQAIFPLIALALLIGSYVSYHRLIKQ